MRKMIALSAVASALFFAGCYDSNSISNANMPEFAKKAAVIESPSDVTKGLIFIEPGMVWGNGGEGIIEIFNANKVNSSVVFPKKLQFLADKIKINEKDLLAKAQRGCIYQKNEDEIECKNGGSMVLVEETKPQDGKCIITEKIEFHQCKMEDEDENISINGSQIFNVFVFIDEDGTPKNGDNILDFKYVMNYKADSKTGEELNWDINNNLKVNTKYNTFVQNKTIKFLKGWSNQINGNFEENDYDGKIKVNSHKFSANFSSQTKEENNAFSVGMNGWVSISYSWLDEGGSLNEWKDGIAAQNYKLIVSHPYPNEEIVRIKASGKIGDLCTQGMMSFTTVKPIEMGSVFGPHNQVEPKGIIYGNLPYTGELKVGGTHSAKVHFVNDHNTTIEANGKTKTYRYSWEIRDDATRGCKIPRLSIFIQNNLNRIFRIIYHIED